MKLSNLVAALVLFTLLACSRKGAGGSLRVPVTVAHAEQRAVPFEIPATGTAEPMQTVSVQSQVTGVLTRVTFHEGDEVAAGQVLFEIDARPFQAALDQASAMQARDQAQQQAAELDAQRYAELVNRTMSPSRTTRPSGPPPTRSRRRSARTPPRSPTRPSTSSGPPSEPRSRGARGGCWCARATWCAPTTPTRW